MKTTHTRSPHRQHINDLLTVTAVMLGLVAILSLTIYTLLER